MNHKLLHSTLRELHMFLVRPRMWLVFALVVLLFSLTGPFGTYEDLAFPARLGYWLTLLSVTWSLALLSIAFCKNALKPWIAQRQIRAMIGGALSTIPISFAAAAINSALLGKEFDSETLLKIPLFTLPMAFSFYGLVHLSLSNEPQDANLAEAQTGAPQAPQKTIETPDSLPNIRPRLLDRLPVEKRGTLLRLEVQDHYVLAVTDKGSHLLLMRLSDAITETGKDMGHQIHRSHWVADAGVKSLTRERTGKSPRLVVETKDGNSLPVSRTYVADIRARWDERLKA